MRLLRFHAFFAGIAAIGCATLGRSPAPPKLNAAADVWAGGTAVPVLPGHPIVPTTPSSTPADSPLLHPEDPFWLAQAPETFRVRVETTRGPFTMELVRALAPIGVDHFYNLVRAGYYDDTAIFRIRAGVFAQFGVHGDPAIARTWRTQTIADDPRA